MVTIFASLSALIAAPLMGSASVTASDILWGIGAGLAGAAGVGILYRGLASGLAAVVSPVAALTGATLPVIFAVMTGERPELVTWIGISLILPAIFLLSSEKGEKKEHVLKSLQLVSDWLTRFGDDLTGIFASDDSAQALGIIEALKKAGREDVVVVAAGNSKVGMDLIKDGGLYAITYQTAEGDGALAVKTAADWFNGKDIPAITNIPQHIITPADVEDFYPPQW